VSLVLLLLLGCPKPQVPPPALVAADAEAAQSRQPAGGVVSGAWVDRRYPWGVRVPAGWEALPGMEGDNPRVTLIHRETRARLEVSVRDDGVLGPLPRRGCDWGFVSQGGYRAVPGGHAVVAATCSPAEPAEARVLGYFLTSRGLAWDLELVTPPGDLLEAKRQADLLLGTFRIQETTPERL
jgi:hypothetical protein